MSTIDNPYSRGSDMGLEAEHFTQIASWEEKDTSGAVLMYGTSVQRLQRMVEGKIMPDASQSRVPKNDLPYQALLRSQAQYFYYSFPANIQALLLRTKNPEFFQGNEKKYPSNYSFERCMRDVHCYAQASALRDGFMAITGQFGVTVEDIHYVGLHYLDEQEYLDFVVRHTKEQNSIHFTMVEGFSTNPKYILRKIETPSCQSILQLGETYFFELMTRLLKLEGCCVFLGDQIFDMGNVQPGYEVENEVLITSKHELPISVISGVRFFSNADKRLAYKN